MRKLLIIGGMLLALFFFAATTDAKNLPIVFPNHLVPKDLKKLSTGPVTKSPESEMLSKDLQFIEMANLLVNFSVDIVQHKKQDALNRYANNTATEKDMKDIKDAVGAKDFEEVRLLFVRIRSLSKEVNGKYTFLAKNEKGSTIIKEAMMQLAKKGQLTKLKLPDVDCLASVMGMFGVCYWMMDQCNIIGNGGGNTDDCVAGVAVCLALAFAASSTCFGWPTI